MFNQIDEAVFVQYLCYIRSAPGMWAAYDGYVEVYAQNDATDDEIFRKAVQKLARTSFPDRPGLSSWVLDRVERA